MITKHKLDETDRLFVARMVGVLMPGYPAPEDFTDDERREFYDGQKQSSRSRNQRKRAAKPGARPAGTHDKPKRSRSAQAKPLRGRSGSGG